MHQPVVPSASSGIPFPRAPQIIFTNRREAQNLFVMLVVAPTVELLAAQRVLIGN